MFDVIPPRQYVGAKAFRKDWDEFLGSTKGSLKYTIIDLAVTTVGTVAYGHSIQRIVGTGIKGDPIDLTTRCPMCIARSRVNGCSCRSTSPYQST